MKSLMNWRQTLIVALLFPATLATADEETYSFADASRLLWACENDKGFAYGLVTGIYDALSDGYRSTGDSTLRMCIPQEMTAPMIAAHVCKDIKDHPALGRLSAVRMVWSSMTLAYPCP